MERKEKSPVVPFFLHNTQHTGFQIIVIRPISEAARRDTKLNIMGTNNSGEEEAASAVAMVVREPRLSALSGIIFIKTSPEAPWDASRC